MNSPLVCVVIVNWNHWPETAVCVASVVATGYVPLQIIVVDNASETEGEALFCQQWPQVQIIHNPANLGFAGGVNLGLKAALAQGAEYLFTLNNDATIAPNCLAELVQTAQADAHLGIVGPKIYYASAKEPPLIWFAGADRHPWALSLLDFGRGQTDGPKFAAPREVNYLCAGAMLTRREVFERVGLFDPAYFMYYEDCDFCLQVVAQGYRLRVVPTAVAWHTVAASTGGEGSPMERYYRTRSVLRFLWQRSRGCHRAVLLTFRLCWIVMQIGYCLISGQTAMAQALGRGLRHGLRDMR